MPHMENKGGGYRKENPCLPISLAKKIFFVVGDGWMDGWMDGVLRGKGGKERTILNKVMPVN